MAWNRTTNHAVARDGRVERRYEVCPKCGKFWKEPFQYVCLNCEQKEDDRQAGSEKARYPHLTLIYSPDDCWTRGGIWYMHELRGTVAAGNMTEGTVFEGSGSGRRYVVVPAEHGQILVEYGAHPGLPFDSRAVLLRAAHLRCADRSVVLPDTGHMGADR